MRSMFVIVKWYQCFTFLPYFSLEPNSCVNKRLLLCSTAFGSICWYSIKIQRCWVHFQTSCTYFKSDIGAGCNIMACYFLSWVSFKIEPLSTTTTTKKRFGLLLYQWLKHLLLLIIKNLFNNLIEVDSC